ncbi:hypothetical protein SDC9_91079 [bioreactor metagenome]|uniref:Uncharacterized protein n=1 Tax=bioreactor metagenome TaxID=1076179 RepID=A0A644ZWU7_9ZZZZ
MQLEETASSKDVPPLSNRGVFKLPGTIAQNNLRSTSDFRTQWVRVYALSPKRNCLKSLV